MSTEEEFSFFDLVSEDLLPSRPTENLGESFLTFDGLLPAPGLKVTEDGGAAGCGGKLWPAGELLSRYMIRTNDQYNGKFTNILELGSGTGLVGLAIASLRREQKDLKVWVTDQENMISLMNQNIALNDLEDTVKAEVLNWGDELPAYATENKIDVVLAADCVYLEAAFPLLEKTLLDLTAVENPPLVLMSYKKRRKADARFFKHMKKFFVFEEIKDHMDYDKFIKDSVFLYKIKRK